MPVRVAHLVAIVTLAWLAASCARATASVEPIMPELEPPPPPPRYITEFPPELPTITPSPVDNALTMPAARKPVPPPPRPDPPKPEPTVAETVGAEPDRPANPAATLTLKPADGVAKQTEANIRGLLDVADRNLQKVNEASLNPDGLAQYRAARRFIQQAEEALRAGNLLFAGKLADKARTMAAVLVR